MEQLKALLRQICVKKLHPDVSRFWSPGAEKGVSRRWFASMCGLLTLDGTCGAIQLGYGALVPLVRSYSAQNSAAVMLGPFTVASYL